MSSIRTIIRHTASAALLAAAALAGPAQAVSIDVGSYTKSGLGAEFATSYDTFTITGDKVSFAMPQTQARSRSRSARSGSRSGRTATAAR